MKFVARRLRPLAPLLLLLLVVFLVAACSGADGLGGSSTPHQDPLRPASPGANPMDLLAWLFTPIFQTFFVTLVLIDQLTGNMAISIIILTLLLRVVLIPLYRRQLVSTRQMQMLQPEIREIQRKHKGDRVRQQAAVQEFYKQRGVNPASGCLPILLQLVLIIPMYSVISGGLTNHDVNAMLNVFGVQLTTLTCDAAPVFDAAGRVTNPCLNPVAFGVNWGIPEHVTTGLEVAGFGISVLAILSAFFQLIQSRMTLPVSDPKNDDPNLRIQRQMAYFLPFISIAYGGILPAGLFLYWIGGTIFSIVQQYLIIGWGGTFPLFGWTPGFAHGHTPRFPVSVPAPKPGTTGTSAGPRERAKPVDRSISARSTIRPSKSRGGRRGRRR